MDCLLLVLNLDSMGHQHSIYIPFPLQQFHTFYYLLSQEMPGDLLLMKRDN